VYQNNEMAAILVYGTGISSFLFKYFVLFHHPTGATDHVSENDLYLICASDCFSNGAYRPVKYFKGMFLVVKSKYAHISLVSTIDSVSFHKE
jgi:hypothetical protein